MAEKFKTETVIDAIRKANGIIAQAAKLLKTSRQTIYNYVEKHPTVKAAHEEANETNIDFVESKLMKAINDGNVTAIIFFLKTKAKARGYVERYEHGGPDGGAIPFMNMNEWKKQRQERLDEVAGMDDVDASVEES